MLVRVKATSVNPIEWKMRRGLKLPVPKPIWRLLLGQPMILGIDFAGTVAAMGPKVDDYRVGDDVMGAYLSSDSTTPYVRFNDYWSRWTDLGVHGDARPATAESGIFVLATEASTAASYWIGPSTDRSGRRSLTSAVAARTFSTSAPEPDSPVE